MDIMAGKIGILEQQEIKGFQKLFLIYLQQLPYNDLDRVESLLKTEAYACIILEPCNTTFPYNGYLSNLKILCEQYGSLFVFDEGYYRF